MGVRQLLIGCERLYDGLLLHNETVYIKLLNWLMFVEKEIYFQLERYALAS